MSVEFLRFLAFIGVELEELWRHYQDGSLGDPVTAERIAMRMARRVSDEIARREIGLP